MKKTIKIISILVLILLIMSVFWTNISLANGDIVNSMSGFEWYGNNGEIKTMGQKVIGVIQVIGVSISVIMLIVIAIRFMMASPSEKAEIKNQLVLYVIGAVILFAATTLLGIVADVGFRITTHV